MAQNSLATENSQFVLRAFRKLSLKEEIVQFMFSYFKNHIITRSQPNNGSFKDSIDTANKELLAPAKDIMDGRLNKPAEEDINRVRIWQEARSEFERLVTLELIGISKKLPT